MKTLNQWLEKSGFVYYFAAVLGLMYFLGGGLSTKAHVGLGGSLIFGIVFLAVMMWGRGKKSDFSISGLGGFCLFCLSGFVISSLVAYYFSVTPNVGLNEVLRMFAGVVFFLMIGLMVVSERISKEGKFKLLLIKMFWVITGFSFIGLAVGSWIYLSFGFNRFVGFFGDINGFDGFYPNAWADYVLLAFPVIVYLMVLSKSWLVRLFLGIELTGILGSLVLTYSRGGWISFAGEAGLVIGTLLVTLGVKKISWGEKRRMFLKGVATVVLICVGGIGFAFGLNQLRGANDLRVESFQEKAAFEADEGEASVNERAEFFEKSFDLIEQRPWTGHGPYSFRFIYPQLQEEMLTSSDHPHNVFLKYGVERGVVSLAFFILFLGSLVVMILRKFRNRQVNDLFLVAIIGSAIAGLLVHSLIDFNLNFAGISLVFWLFLGMIFGLTVEVKKQKGKRFGFRFVVLMIGILSAAGAVIGFHELYYGLIWREARLMELPRDAVIDPNSDFDYSNFSYRDAEYGMREHGEVAEERTQKYLVAMNIWQKKDLPVIVLKDLIRQGRHEEAVEFADEWVEKYPHYAEAWYLWGEALRYQGNLYLAEEKYERALEIDGMNDLRFYVGRIRTIDLEEREEFEKRAMEVLETYKLKLRNNRQFTAITFNPIAAMELARWMGETELFEELRELRRLEIDKLENPEKYLQG